MGNCMEMCGCVFSCICQCIAMSFYNSYSGWSWILSQLPYGEGLSLADVFGHLERNRLDMLMLIHFLFFLVTFLSIKLTPLSCNLLEFSWALQNTVSVSLLWRPYLIILLQTHEVLSASEPFFTHSVEESYYTCTRLSLSDKALRPFVNLGKWHIVYNSKHLPMEM